MVDGVAASSGGASSSLRCPACQCHCGTCPDCQECPAEKECPAAPAPAASCSPQAAAPPLTSSAAAAWSTPVGKTLVVLVTARDDNTNANSHDYRMKNLDFFLRQALLPQDPNFHFVIVVQGQWPERRGALEGAAKWAREKGVGNVQVIFRQNVGFDFCAWRRVLDGSIKLFGGKSGTEARDAKDFSFFVLLNGSVRGPLLPSYWPRASVEGAPRWPRMFTDKLVGNTRLVGTSVNCAGSRLHLQSMTLAVGADDRQFFVDNCACAADKNDAVGNEYDISQAFLNAGKNLGAMQLGFRDHNFLDRDGTNQKCAVWGLGSEDRYYPPGTYMGGVGDGAQVTFNPLEMVLFKNNRNVMPQFVDAYSTWQLGSIPSEVPEEALSQPAVGPDPPLDDRRRELFGIGYHESD